MFTEEKIDDQTRELVTHKQLAREKGKSINQNPGILGWSTKPKIIPKPNKEKGWGKQDIRKSGPVVPHT